MTGVYFARDAREASILAELLLKNGIDPYSQEKQSGAFMKVTTDLDFSGTQLFVEDENVQKAKTLIASEIARSKRENPNGELGKSLGDKEWKRERGWRIATGVAIGVIAALIITLSQRI